MGLREYMIKKAIERYRKGGLSQGAAADFAGLSVQEFHQELSGRGFVLRVDKDRLENELEGL